MSDVAAYLWLIPALPLAGFVLTAAFGPRLFRRHSHWPCVLATMAACVLSLFVLAAVIQSPAAEWHRYYTWIHASEADIGFTLRADPLTAWMMVTVTFISSCIAVYSIGYMHGDQGYARFFAEMALFVFSMTGLVLADNFILLYVFWEGVGLCSYLLIGFWFTRPSAAAAARKAFLVTRLGDLGFILGIVLVWIVFGHRLDYETVFGHARDHQGMMPAICLLLFCGAIGKSAQFPLYVWLPDAMEGPTPVSALIHAATMVTAGVYMVARCMPLFREVPGVLLLVACIGTFTAFLAALIALTQNDLKRVLAYSTISQLGYMFLALGSAGGGLVTMAVAAAIFHLFTHAFFKALLFLSAGSVMHAMGGVIDMRRFRGLRRLLKHTHWTFLCGALALAGFPLFAGFWSKDDILAVAYGAGAYHWAYIILFLTGLATAGLTAFYTFRAYFLTFWGEERIPAEAGQHVHESPAVMLVPLMILSVGAVFAGFMNAEPVTGWLGHFLGLGETEASAVSAGTKAWLMVMSSLCAGGGIFMAWWMYMREPGLAGRLADRLGALYHLSLNKFHVDELYNALIVKPLEGFAALCRFFDLHVLDGIVDTVGHLPGLCGAVFRPIQNGLVQFYALAMVLGLAVFLIALVQALTQ